MNLVPIFEGIDTSAFKAIAEAIQQQDAQAFAAAYRLTLDACYGCHKASGKPYLRPMIPTAPAQTIINLDPAATWPQLSSPSRGSGRAANRSRLPELQSSVRDRIEALDRVRVLSANRPTGCSALRFADRYLTE